MAETATIGAGELEGLIASALIASRTAEVNARSVARALAQAEIDGQKGHGISRVPIYAAQARAGKVDGHATPVARQTQPGSLMIDVANGFAFPAVSKPKIDELSSADVFESAPGQWSPTGLHVGISASRTAN